MNRKLTVVLAGVALFALFVVDINSESVPLLQYLCVPVVLAAGFAGRRTTAILAATAIILTITAIAFYDAADTSLWIYCVANVVVCIAAVWFASRRESAENSATAILEDFTLALKATPLPSALVDLDGRVTAVNPAFTAFTGYPAEWADEHQLAELVVDASPDDRARLRNELLADPTLTRIQEERVVLADGREAWVREHIAVMRDASGDPRGYIVQFEDVTADRAQLRTLEDRASTDPMTGLLNRRGLLEQLQPHLSTQRRDDKVAVLMLDLDGLKPVNDSLGHQAGDELIRTVADRIRMAVRDEDIVARIGGDEFVVALKQVHGIESAAGVAEKVRAAIAAPLAIAGVPVRSSASIGVAEATGQEEPARIVARADRAQYRAKRAGGNRVVLFDAALDDVDVEPEPLPRTQ